MSETIGERIPQVTYAVEQGPADGMTPTTATRTTATVARVDVPGDLAAAEVNAQRLADLMVPVPVNPAGWSPDGFRWLLYRDETGLRKFPVIFPRHDAPLNQLATRPLRTAAYTRPIVVTPIPPDWNPADATRDYVAGQLSAVLLTIDAGRPIIDFTLYPTTPEPGSPDAAVYSWDATAGTWDAQTGTWNDQTAGLVVFRWNDPSLAGVTWNQLEPSQSWNLYRLAKGT